MLAIIHGCALFNVAVPPVAGKIPILHCISNSESSYGLLSGTVMLEIVTFSPVAQSLFI